MDNNNYVYKNEDTKIKNNEEIIKDSNNNNNNNLEKRDEI